MKKTPFFASVLVVFYVIVGAISSVVLGVVFNLLYSDVYLADSLFGFGANPIVKYLIVGFIGALVYMLVTGKERITDMNEMWGKHNTEF